MGRKIILIFAFFLIMQAVPAMAGSKGAAQPPEQGTLALAEAGSVPASSAAKSSSGLPIPRFVSLASGKVFVRTGPALRYPIKWVYGRERMPVEIVQEFDTWRKIRDIDGDDGWIHQSLLSGERSAIIKRGENAALRRTAEADGRVLAWLEPNVIARAEECRGRWCRLSAGGYNGWVERKYLWGIYDSEDFD